jgi:UDP-N-acetylmuramoyl-L-alanyl-D-glutamate--2,6-diaminopimelate ligase
MGRFNVSNMLVAAAATGALGVPVDTILKLLRDHRSVRGRLEEVADRNGMKVFVDYAHTDDALDKVLQTLREITTGRLIVVFGCGGNRDRTKRPKMGAVAARQADVAIVTSDNPRKEEPAAIIEDILGGMPADARGIAVEDRGEAIRKALLMGRSGDSILIAGKGHEEFQEFANRTVPFDDRDVVRAALLKE